MDDFENKTPEMQEPASSEDNIPETPETAETIPAAVSYTHLTLPTT